MVMMEPGMPPTPVQINVPGQTLNNQASEQPSTSTAEADLLTDAAESLQALAGVVQIGPNVTETLGSVQPPKETQTNAEDEREQEDTIAQEQDFIERSEREKGTSSNNEATEESSEVHLTSDQLLNLEAGDYIEINGQTYKVEFQVDS